MPTPVSHYTLTLTGAAQQLVLPGTPSSDRTRIRELSLQPGEANAAPVYVGGPLVSAVDYGVRLPIAAAGVPPAPFVFGEYADGKVQLEDFWVIGTAAETVTVLVLAYV